MVRGNDGLGMDHEAVNQISKELTEFAQALADMRAYAHADDGLTADKFGVLGQRTGVGQTYTQLRDTLRDVLDKATPVVDAMSQALAYAQRQTVEVDSRVASDISKADRMR
jgi:LmbE family N-acetylglucosaminyl deacetylase